MKPPASLADVPVWVINLDRRADRWEAIVAKCAAAGLSTPNRWPAVDGRATITPQELARYRRGTPAGPDATAACWGNCKSHLGLVAHLWANETPWALVLEDDAVFHPELLDRYATFAELVPDDALMLMLGCSHTRSPLPVAGTDELVWRVRRCCVSHGYMVALDSLPLLHELAAPMTTGFDNVWNGVHALGRSYSPDPHLIWQEVGNYSDISRRPTKRARRWFGPKESY